MNDKLNIGGTWLHLTERPLTQKVNIGDEPISKRTDFRWSGENNVESLFALEINTQPGMTITSLVPELLEKQGISYSDLILYLLEDASCDR